MTTKPPYESLSKLHSGDLPPAEATALRERVRTEPELASAAADVDALVSLLGSLPLEAPPSGLDDRVLQRGPQVARGSLWAAAWRKVPRGRAALPWAVAGLAVAATVLLALRPADRTQVLLVSGEQTVEGRVDLLAGDAAIALSGRAHILVEPVEASVREPLPEDPMKVVMGSLGGALVGAVVTVAVLEGRATVTAADGAEISLDAGEQHVLTPKAASGPRQERAPAQPAATLSREALEAEVASLREQLAEAQFTGAVARGQVARSQGEAIPWPADADPAWAPAAFEHNLRAELAKIPGLELQQLDCEEYPCVATLVGKDMASDVQDKLKQLQENLTGSNYPDAGVWMGVANHGNHDGTQSVAVGLSLMPPRPSDAVRTRTDFRAGNLLHDLEAQLEPELDPDPEPSE